MLKSLMEEVREVSRSLCAFPGDYALKWRKMGKHSDVRVGLKTVNYASFDSRTRVRFVDHVGIFRASTWTGRDDTFSFEPVWPCRGIMLSILPLPSRVKVSLSREIAVTERMTWSGSLEASDWLKVPNARIHAAYDGVWWKVAQDMRLHSVNERLGVTGDVEISVSYGEWLTKLVCEVTKTGRVVGVKGKGSGMTLGVIGTFSGVVNVMIEARIAERWKAGVAWSKKAIMEMPPRKVLTATAFGVQYDWLCGYTKVAWQRANVIATKWKCRVARDHEVSGCVHVTDSDFMKPRVGFSWCVSPNTEEEKPSIASFFSFPKK